MNNVKILCIAGSIVLGSILLSGQAFGKAPSDLSPFPPLRSLRGNMYLMI